ncbi:PotD/PotF family extracellular solute-binding protein [Leptolyngbya sp. FACHB-261]|uniref:ABC transporter substrate-binding protein n=1 Tax=Leptolyngbya sp. FACHB-261 TaxID=2692806 RepID=UPI001686E5C7|nr:spermidine/putrescine ABC transporter substrate-binding protein [Leptolyngbya sp. FACHB-261]MBD2100037.1 spermidine/putrescine ABC transporter substrate-binding protein [Leptolyngbya sp. FACHB-261]
MVSLSTMKRRQFVQRSSYFLLGLGLSACSFADGSSKGAKSSTAEREPSSATASGTLNIYTYTSYVNPKIQEKFTQNTGIQVIADTYDSNETMLAKIQARGGAGYSILSPSDYMVTQMVELGLLEPLDKSLLQGLNQLAEPFQNPAYDPNNAHSLPMTWGTTGIAYNSKLLPKAPTDWTSLWELKEEIKGRLTLADDVREVMGMTLHSLGYSYNSTDKSQIEEAYEKLRELKPTIASFNSDGWRPQMLSGDVVVSMAYSGDGLAIGDENPDIKYVIPAGGTSLWTDTIAIPKAAPNKAAAYAWVNALLQPENAAEISSANNFSTPNKAAIALVPEKLKNNPNWQPSEQILAKCERIQPVDEPTQALLDDYWTRLKSI